MQEMTVNPGTGEGPEVELGVRMVQFVLRHRRLLIWAPLVCVTIGAVTGAILGRRYTAEATIEVGSRPPSEDKTKEFLESPLLARIRLEGFLLAARGYSTRDVSYQIDNTLEDETKQMTGQIALKVTSDTASAAQSVMDQTLTKLVDFHGGMQGFERKLLEEERGQYDRWIAKLDEVGAQGGDQTQLLPDETGVVRERHLDSARLETSKLAAADDAALSSYRLTPTRITSRTRRAKRLHSPIPPLVLGGLFFGLIAGIALGAVMDVGDEKLRLPRGV